MRIPSKQSLVRVSLLFIFAFPTLAVATDEAKTSTPRDLSLSEAMTAFGPDFRVKDVGGTYTLFGASSDSCFQAGHFAFTNDAAAGTVRIQYDGKDDSCLSYKTQVDANATLVSLSDQDGAKFKPTQSFAAVSLVSKRPSGLESDPESIPSDEKDADGKAAPLSFTSTADREAQKKQAKIDERNAGLETKMKIVTSCRKGFEELDVANGALEDLMKDVEFAGKNQEWLTDQKRELADVIFRACKTTFRRSTALALASAEDLLGGGEDLDDESAAVADDFPDSDADELKAKAADSKAAIKLKKARCGERLYGLAQADPIFARKVIGYYFGLAKRFASAAENGAIGLEDAESAIANIYQRIEDTIDYLGDDKLEEKATVRLAAEKKATASTLLQAATKPGVDPKVYAKLRGDLLEIVKDQDGGACFLPTDSVDPITHLAAPLPNQRNGMTKGCQDAYAFMRKLVGSDQTALANQKFFADQMLTNTCLNARNTATINKTSMTPEEQSTCALPLAKYDNDAKLSANAGLNPNGYASVENGTTATNANPGTTTTNTANGGSALVNTVYTSQSAPQQTVTIPVSNVQTTTPVTPPAQAPAPVTNTVHLHH